MSATFEPSAPNPLEVLGGCSPLVGDAVGRGIMVLLRGTRELEDHARRCAMLIGELINHDGAIETVAGVESAIEERTPDVFLQRMMKAIIYEEQVHMNPPRLEAVLEQWGLGDTVGVSQISESRWARQYGATRAELLEPASHLTAMDAHLAYVTETASQRGIELSPAWIGTLWNYLAAREVTEYGSRVARYYRDYGGTPTASLLPGPAPDAHTETEATTGPATHDANPAEPTAPFCEATPVGPALLLALAAFGVHFELPLRFPPTFKVPAQGPTTAHDAVRPTGPPLSTYGSGPATVPLEENACGSKVEYFPPLPLL